MNVNPGSLNKKIRIIVLVQEQDENGIYQMLEATYASVWSAVSQKSANEAFKANADYQTDEKRFLIRFLDGIDYKMFIKYENVLYNIIFMNDYNEEHKYIEIVGKKVDKNG